GRLSLKREDQITHFLLRRLCRSRLHIAHVHPRHPRHGAHRLLQPAFRIQEKARARDDSLSRRKPRENFVVAVILVADFHLGRLESTLSFIEEHDLSDTRVQNRFIRHSELPTGINVYLCVRIHLRLQDKVAVRKLQSHFRCSSFFVENRRDPRNSADEISSRIGSHSDRRLSSNAYLREL